MGEMCIWMFIIVSITYNTLADWDENCPRNCKCTYASNRKFADCLNADFSTIPKTLSTEVQELNLVNNHVRYLDKNAFKKEGLINLQKLYLGNNKIDSVHMDGFKGLSIMIELDLSSNYIKKLHPMTFTGMEKLRVLDLSNNLLSGLNDVQFPPLHHLRKLIFTSNTISYIHNNAFVNLPLLNSLKLSENELKQMEPKLFTNNTALKELELHHNFWHCDCHLKSLIKWVKAKSLLQTHISCHTPQSLSGKKWEELSENELACRPELSVPQVLIPAALGQNTSLFCHAKGEPLPKIKWVLNGRVLTNLSVIRFSDPDQRFVVRERVFGGEIIRGHVIGGQRRSYLTVTRIIEDDFTYYTCVAENIAGLVERNVSLIQAGTVNTGAMTPKNEFDVIIIIGIVALSVVFLIIIFVVICCCVVRRKSRKPKPRIKLNGSVNHSEENKETKNVIVVNPVDKPARQYKKVPQTDMELSLNPESDSRSASRYYDNVQTDMELSLNTEIDSGNAHQHTHTHTHTHQYTHQLLETLDEENDASLDTSIPLDSTSYRLLADYMAQYPDLLDMAKPRAVFPTQLSYHSVVVPAVDFYTHGLNNFVPVAYGPIQTRPGYVTLPRKLGSAFQSPSSAGQLSSQSPSLAGQLSIQSPSLAGQLCTQSPSLAGELSTQSPSLAGELSTQSPSLAGQLCTQSPSLAGELSTQSPSLAGQLSTQSPSLAGELSTQSPSLAGQFSMQSSSCADQPSTSDSQPPSACEDEFYYEIFENFDTFGPRTTADGTSHGPRSRTIDTGSHFGVIDPSKKVEPKLPPKKTKRVCVSASSHDIHKKSCVVAENGKVFQDQEMDGTDV